MSCAKLKADILAAREAREAMLHALLGEAATVFISTAIPGPHKELAGSEALFRWGLDALAAPHHRLRILAQGWDVLGLYAVAALAEPAALVKRHCMTIEGSWPAARLLDLDVYTADGRRLGRVDTGQPPRTCLLCPEPASDCIRLQRHAPETLIRHAEHLLACFRAASLR